ncbi:MAG: dihydroneopterin aldolase [Pseudomonadota bacterium]
MSDEIIEATQDVIVVENLRLKTYVGVFDFEREARQSLRLDIRIVTVPGYRDAVREQKTYVSYGDVVAFAENKARSADHVMLVEDWAEDVAAFVLKNPLVEKVQVKVTKPDIFPSADGVGIQVERKRAS